MDSITLYNSDCLIGMQQIETGTVDLVLCDLPYGTTNCSWDAVLPFDRLWEQCRRLLKPHGALVLFAAQPFATDLINSARKLFRYDLVWEKTAPVGFANAKRQPLRAHELVLLFYKKQPTYNPQGLVKLENPVLKGGPRKAGGVYRGGLDKEYVQEYTNYPRSILRFPFRGRRQHPTQKPLELMEYLVRTYTNPGDLVLDNCMGSGTTGLACVNTDRRFIGFELDQKYFSIAKQRIDNRVNELVV